VGISESESQQEEEMSSNPTPFPLGRLEEPEPQAAKFALHKALPAPSKIVWRDHKWKVGPVLDQGAQVCPLAAAGVYPHDPYCKEQGFCVGFGWESFLEAKPTRSKTHPPGLEIYHRAQTFDQWRGEAYAGSSVLGGVKALHEAGRIEQYLWSFDVGELADFIRAKGTVVVGTDWLADMFWPDQSDGYLLKVSGALAGGHAYHLTWYYKQKVFPGGPVLRNVFEIKNSWGDWANNGFAYIRRDDLQSLLDRDGEACTAVERKVV
jgi:hypothetical protein